jgi:two-component system LytT family response regulator
MSNLRVLTVDDEVLASRRLKHVLSNIDGVQCIGQAAGCDEGLAKIRDLRPDVVLLDIAMRNETGFDLLERLEPEYSPLVIFVSAFDHYAVRAFEVSAIDYVLKPVESARVKEALARASARLSDRSSRAELGQMREVVETLRKGRRKQEVPRHESELWIRTSSGGLARVEVSKIEWVESEDDYVRIHTAHNSYLLRSSIKGLEARIDASMFTRIHRRTLVRTDLITEVTSKSFAHLQVRLHGGQSLRVGRIYAQQLRRSILRGQISESGSAARSSAC